MKGIYVLFFFFIGFSSSFAQQVADTLYNPPIAKPEYPKAKGPVVFIDEGHFNFHTKEGRYKAFSNLLERDGYQVNAYKGSFTREKLEEAKILVISNALHETTVGNWVLPTPSAFTEEEIATVKQWVNDGGSLFLIADHMPLAGAAAELALAFDVEFSNGFVFNAVSKPEGIAYFNRKDGSLIESAITKGRNADENVEQVVSFTGQVFRFNQPMQQVLVLDERYINKLPDTAWSFHKNTPQHGVDGWSQGACGTVGKGRLAVFGEAAMFSAQLAGPEKNKAGMNHEIAPENYKLLLNIIHWLDGKLD